MMYGLKDKIVEALETIELQETQLRKQKAQLLSELHGIVNDVEIVEKGLYSLEDIKEFEDCAFTFKCPLFWDDLKKTDADDVKYCSVCSENVYHVPNLLAFKKRVKEKKIKCISIKKCDDNGEEEILMGTPVWRKS